MPRIIEFEGRRIELPDDATDAEIAQALGGMAASAPPPAAVNPRIPESALQPLPPPVAQHMVGLSDVPLPDTVPAQPDVPSSPVGKAAWQGAARGVGEFVMTLPDLAAMTANAPMAVTDYALGKVGLPQGGFRFPMPSDAIANAASKVANHLNIDVADPDKMSFAEKMGYNISRFGAQGGLSGTLLARLAARRAAQIAATERPVPRVGDSLLKPYMDKSPAAAVAGDTAAGAGAGTAVTLTQQLPEEVRGAAGGTAGTLADFIAMGLGGVGGGTAADVIAKGPGALKARITQHMPARDVPLDAEGNAVTNQLADRVARHWQQNVSNTPSNVAQTIADQGQWYRDQGLPTPTAGLISGDTGLENMERGLRKESPTPFMNRDRDLHEAARAEVQATRPQDANPREFTDTVERLAQEQIDRARQGVDRAETYVGRVANVRAQDAAALRSYGGEAQGRAGLTADEVLVNYGLDPATREKNRLYMEGVPPDTPVDLTGARRAAADVRADTATLLPSMQARIADPALLDDMARSGPATYEQARRTRMVLSEEAKRARSAEEYARAENIDRLREPYNRAIDTANPAAERYYREDFAPYRGQGPGDEMARFRSDRNRDYEGRTFAPPSETVPRFLGKGSPEDARSLRAGLDASGQPTRGVDAVGEWLHGSLAQSGAVRGDTLDPAAIQRWIDKNDGVLQAFPEARQQLQGIQQRAQRGEVSAQQFRDELRNAQTALRNTEDEMHRGAFRHVLGRDPEHAVRDIFGSGDPERNMAAVHSRLAGNPDAQVALKQSVADWLYNKVSNINPAAVHEGNEAVSMARITKVTRDNERTMVEAGFTPDDMNALRRAQKLLEPMAKKAGQATTGSPTAENQNLGWRLFEIGAKTWYGGLKGGNITRNARLAREMFAPNVADPARDLAVRVMLDPELASHLLTRNVREVGTPVWNAKLQRLLRYKTAGQELLDDE